MKVEKFGGVKECQYTTQRALYNRKRDFGFFLSFGKMSIMWVGAGGGDKQASLIFPATPPHVGYDDSRNPRVSLGAMLKWRRLISRTDDGLMAGSLTPLLRSMYCVLHGVHTTLLSELWIRLREDRIVKENTVTTYAD